MITIEQSCIHKIITGKTESKLNAPNKRLDKETVVLSYSYLKWMKSYVKWVTSMTLNEKSRLLNSMYSVIPFLKMKYVYIGREKMEGFTL